MPQLGHNLQLIHFEQGHNYSLAVIKAKSLYQLRFICYNLKLIDLITILHRYLYHMIKTTMLGIHSTVQIGAINMYIIIYIYHMIKHHSTYSCE